MRDLEDSGLLDETGLYMRRFRLLFAFERG